nr:hypothetical protein [uncultured Kingella sp.]
MKKPLLALALCASLTTAQAAEPFVGHYHSGGVDWAQNLMLMDNNRFCFALIAGSLDLITGGTWQASKQGNISTIELTETRLKLPDLLLAATSSGGQAKIGKKRAMMFSAYELDSVLSAHQIRYAFSHSDTPPPKPRITPHCPIPTKWHPMLSFQTTPNMFLSAPIPIVLFIVFTWAKTEMSR